MPVTVQLNAPGVPPLIGGVSIQLPSLMTADTSTNYGSVRGSQWGVFLDGAPVVVFDTFVSIDYRQGWALSDYPVERGGFQTFDKVQLPFDVRVRFAAGGSESNRAALLASIAAISRSLLLYSVVTPEKTYVSVNVQHYDYHRTAINGVGLLTVELWLLEVRVTANSAQQDNTGANGNTVDSSGNSTNTNTDNTPNTDNPFVNSPADPSGNSPTNSGNIPTFDAGSTYGSVLGGF